VNSWTEWIRDVIEAAAVPSWTRKAYTLALFPQEQVVNLVAVR